MSFLHSTIACNLDRDLLTACYPLLAEERVEAMEWSFDALFDRKHLPGWFEELLHVYSREKRLIGHGVYFSLFSGKWLDDQAQWLELLRRTSLSFPFDHVTEHFGFMTGKDFHTGAPLPIPYTPATLRIGQDRLQRISDAANCPVGLENLAFSYTVDEVKRHGDFLRELIRPINGFIILDLHNVYCQLHNFSIDSEELLALYPLDLVREIHISGGSWQSSSVQPDKKIRRDTHDDGVPEEVYALLENVLDRCTNCKYVVLEQIGNSLATDHSRKQFYDDYLGMETIVKAKNSSRSIEGKNPFGGMTDVQENSVEEDEQLYAQQRELASILETTNSYTEAITALRQSTLAGSAWNIDQWEPEMLDTAIKIAQKWKKN